MIKFEAKNVQKRTLELCKIEADKAKYVTAPLRVYQDIRTQFTIAKTVDEIVELGCDRELVELIKGETF